MTKRATSVDHVTDENGVRWPIEIPMPRRGCFSERHGMLSWISTAFWPTVWRPNCIDAGQIFLDAMTETVAGLGYYCIADWDREPSRTNDDRVRLWDQTAAKFDYERTEEDWVG